MLTYSELKELSSMSGDGKLFVSLYLDVDPLTNPKADYVIHFKNMLKEKMDGLDKDVEKKIKEDIGKIERFLRDNKREFKKGIAVISSSGLDIWRNYHLSLPVKNEIVIDKSPYINPLLFLLDNYQRCAVLLVDKELARIFIIHLGEIDEYTELFTPDIPGKHKRGGWFSLQQARFERHIDYHVNLHIKDVVKTLEDFLHKESINKIIMGGSEDAIAKAKKMLPNVTTQKIISTFHAEITMGEKEVLGKTLRLIEEFEKEKAKNTIEKLITKAMKNEMAVTGHDDVLFNLNEGRVMRLIFLKDIVISGYRCTGCGFLTTQEIKSCLYCGGKVEKMGNLIDFVVQKSMQLSVPVEVITESAELAKAGGIGAFLRF